MVSNVSISTRVAPKTLAAAAVLAISQRDTLEGADAVQGHHHRLLSSGKEIREDVKMENSKYEFFERSPLARQPADE